MFYLRNSGKIKHIGYMKGKFKTKKDAVSYYDKHNPHMRSLNAHNTYKSDWDPKTKLLYIVICNNRLSSSEFFNGFTKYKWLK